MGSNSSDNLWNSLLPNLLTLAILVLEPGAKHVPKSFPLHSIHPTQRTSIYEDSIVICPMIETEAPVSSRPMNLHRSDLRF